MLIPASRVADVVQALYTSEKRSAIKYLSPKFVIKATARGKHTWDKRNRGSSVIVTYGAPNYNERKFIKLLVSAGEPFPVRKIQLKDFPKSR